jgi:hypothetical protein
MPRLEIGHTSHKNAVTMHPTALVIMLTLNDESESGSP